MYSPMQRTFTYWAWVHRQSPSSHALAALLRHREATAAGVLERDPLPTPNASTIRRWVVTDDWPTRLHQDRERDRLDRLRERQDALPDCTLDDWRDHVFWLWFVVPVAQPHLRDFDALADWLLTSEQRVAASEGRPPCPVPTATQLAQWATEDDWIGREMSFFAEDFTASQRRRLLSVRKQHRATRTSRHPVHVDA